MRRLSNVLLVVLCLIIAAGAYFVYPIFTLKRIETAIKDRDSATLEALIDWDRIRSGIRSDLKGALVGKTGTDGWSALGAALGATMLDSVIEGQVSPGGLLRLTEIHGFAGLNDRLAGFRFTTPTTCAIDFEAPNEERTRVTILFELQGVTWRATRLVLPPDFLTKTKPPNSARAIPN